MTGRLSCFTCTDLNQLNWHATGRVSDLLDTFKEFHPAIRAMCALADDVKLYKLLYRSPVPQWTHGKTIVIGDAIHPMLPRRYYAISGLLFRLSLSPSLTDQAQGGNQAPEDAAALYICLTNFQDTSEVPDRLQAVQGSRRDRAAALQIFSNAGQDQAKRTEKAACPFVKGSMSSKLITAAPSTWLLTLYSVGSPPKLHAWTFSHNELEHSRAVLYAQRVGA